MSNLFSGRPFSFNAQISIWLWFTVLFANFAEALAKAGERPRQSPAEGQTRRMRAGCARTEERKKFEALSLRKGDIVLREDGDPVPGDGG